jgi:hypothetical protein
MEKYYVFTYENGTMRPVSKKEEGRIKNDGGGESNIYCKRFCKCHNVLQVQL